MFTASVRTVLNVGGMNFQGADAVRSASGQISQQPNLPAAKSGTLTGRTDNDTGVATLAGGHGIISTDKVDVYWTGGRRYGMTATVAVNAVSVDGGTGDNLPAQDTPVTVVKPTPIDLDFVGDKLKAIGAYCEKRGILQLLDGSDGVQLAVTLEPMVPYVWIADNGVANPIAGDTIAKALMSQSDAGATPAMSLGILYDSAS